MMTQIVYITHDSVSHWVYTRKEVCAHDDTYCVHNATQLQVQVKVQVQVQLQV